MQYVRGGEGGERGGGGVAVGECRATLLCGSDVGGGNTGLSLSRVINFCSLQFR